jgi:phage-related protein
VVDWRIEYFRESSGRVPVQEFIDRLTTEERVETMVGIDMLRIHGLSLARPWVAPLKKSLWELRIRSRRQLRILYFAHSGKTFVLLHAFVKKTRDVPQSEIETAMRRMGQHLRRSSYG